MEYREASGGSQEFGVGGRVAGSPPAAVRARRFAEGEGRVAIRSAIAPRCWALLALLAALCWLPSGAAAQEAEDPVKVTGRPAAPLAPGGTTELLFTLHIDKAYYVYRDQVSLALQEQPGFRAGTAVLPPGEKKFDKVMEMEVEIYKGETLLRLPVSADPGLAEGPVTLTGLVTYQCCAETYCLMPVQVQVPVAVTLFAAAAAGPPVAEGAPAAAAAAPAGESARLAQALERGFFWALLFVFAGGILASLTPCVYPMIPITISIIGARSAGGKLKGFSLSLVYVLGIAVTYSGLGMAAARSGALFGAAMQNSWVIGGIAAVFFVLGLSMLGAFELQVPASVSTRLGSYQGRGLAGVLLMGMITGLVASPCVGPILVALLAFVAQSGSVLVGFALLFTFAMGMGLLFLVLGTFSGMLVNLPRSGLWMEGVKSVFGLVMIGMAFYYVRPLLPEALFPLLFGAFLCLAGLVYGWPPAAEGPAAAAGGMGRRWLVGGRRAFGVLCLAVGLYLFIGGLVLHGFVLSPLGGAAGVLQPAGRAAAGERGAGPDWLADEAGALTRAVAEGKPAVIDFTADWCAACKELDKFTWSDPGVLAELRRFVGAQVDFTRKTAEVERLTAKYGIRGLPTVIFFDRQGREARDQRLTGFVDKERMLEILRGIS